MDYDIPTIIIIIISLISLLADFFYFIRNKVNTTKKEPEAEKLIRKIDNLKKIDASKTDIRFYKEEYKKICFYDQSGLSLNSKDRKRIIKFLQKYQYKINWNQIKNANKYFDFSNRKIKISIPFTDKFFFAVFTSLTLLLLASTIYYTIIFGKYVNPDMDLFKYFVIIPISTGITIISAYPTVNLMIPIITARLIKNLTGR